MNFPAFATNARQLLVRIPTTATIAVVALGIAAIPFAGLALQYERSRIIAGELWRLATCHVTHWNGEHLLWDLLMFVVLAAWCEWRNPQRMRLCLIFGAMAVSSTVYLFFPHMHAYRGLSGVDTALFTLLAVELFREAAGTRPIAIRCHRRAAAGVCSQDCLRSIYRQHDLCRQQAAGFVPLVWDHLAGAVVGIVVALGPSTSFRTRATLLSVTKNSYPSV